MNKAAELLKLAKKQARLSSTWADFSNYLFDPIAGIVSRAFPGRAEREAFIKTSEYTKIQDLLDEVQKRTGLVEGATPTKSGRFVVRLPASLHAALENEAKQEGVSLNQLVVAKLAAQLNKVVLK